jgi:hypothetical protein
MTVFDAKLASQTLSQQGWIFFTPPVLNDRKTWALSLGPLIPHRRTGLLYTDLVPYSEEEAPRGSMSAVVGKGPQPMHSDGAHVSVPPRYLVFECIDAGEQMCPTQIWVLNLEAIIAAQYSLLTLPQWIYRDGVQSFYGSIVHRANQGARIRFDPSCMAPASFSRSSILEVESILKFYSEERSINWETGAILVIDNWQCLHGRHDGSVNSPKRKLRRWQIGDGDGVGQRPSVRKG